MKHALVTGGAGFVGSHLTEALLQQGARVTVIDDESTGCRENLAKVIEDEHLHYLRGPVEDASVLERVINEVDEVYHLAAAVGVSLIDKKPMETIQRNIYPTHLLFQLASKRHLAGHSIKVFVASSSEVYGKNPKASWTEEDDLVFGPTRFPRWSYGASKAIDEFLALAYWRQDGLPVVVGRFFNVVGPRQRGEFGMVLPRFVEAAVANQPMIVHDDGEQIRCFAHVSDVVGAVLSLMQTPEAPGQIVNIGSDRPVSIRELAEIVRKIADSTAPIEYQTYQAAYRKDFEDVRRRVPDLTRLRSIIDFSPHHKLEEIVAELVYLQRRNQARSESE